MNTMNTMNTLNALGFNFNTVENTFKTIGTLAIIIIGIALIINEAINPSGFTL